MPININVPNLPYASIENPQIDFSALAQIGTIPERLRMRELRNKFERGEITDYDQMWKELGKADPLAAAKMLASDSGGQYGYNLEFDDQGNAYRAGRGGDMLPVTPPGGGKFVNRGSWVQTSRGLVWMPAGGVTGGTDGAPVPSAPTPGAPTPGASRLSPPTPVQTQDYTMDESGNPVEAPTQTAQGAIPTVESEKWAHERKATQATDRALTERVLANLDKQIKTFSQLLDPSGRPSKQLRAITGNYKLNGKETPIPNAWLMDVTEDARNASANLETAAVQVGLDTLEQMRAASAQGASGMGQLAIQESLWLQNSIANLNKTQGTPQAAQHIQDILNHSKRIRDIVSQKYRSVYGEDIDGGGGGGANNDDPLGLF